MRKRCSKGFLEQGPSSPCLMASKTVTRRHTSDGPPAPPALYLAGSTFLSAQLIGTAEFAVIFRKYYPVRPKKKLTAASISIFIIERVRETRSWHFWTWEMGDSRLPPPRKKRSDIFWDVTKRWLVVTCRRFGTTCRFHLRLNVWMLKSMFERWSQDWWVVGA